MPQKLETVKTDIEIHNLSEKLHGLKIVHIGDLHTIRVGKKNKKLAGEIKAQQPDFIFCTGDMFDRFAKNGDAFLELLEQLRGEFPVYVCMGNHEDYSKEKHPEELDAYSQKLKKHKVIMLDDGCAELDYNGQIFKLYGLNTGTAHVDPTPEMVTEKLGERAPECCSIVLAHKPIWFDALAGWGADLVLSGHHHGGLIRLPGKNKRGLFGNAGQILPRYDWGKYRRDNAMMYITRGFGGSEYKVRVNNPYELGVLTLKPLTDVQPEDLRKPLNRPRWPMKTLKWLITLMLLLLSAWCALPLVHGKVNPGIWLPTLFSAVYIPLLWQWKKLSRKNRRLKWLLRAFGALICAVLVVSGVLSAIMVNAANNAPKESMTVIVLGGEVKSYGPSVVVAGRLKTAAAFLEEYPDAVCIVSGGIGRKKNFSKAEVMKEYLVTVLGVAPERIFEEDESRNTFQNINFSREIIEQNGLPEKVAIATDGFHQYRASLLAGDAGLESYALSADTRKDFLGSFWIRELLALVKYLIIKR